MKTLTLLRHAKTERDSPEGDFGRSLIERGRKDAGRMGEKIRELGLDFDLVLASPARRALETVEQLGKLAPIFEPRIYNASSSQLYDLIRSTDDGVGSLLMVGHNPGLEELAAVLTAEGVDAFPTTSLAEIELSVDRWSEVKAGSGRLRRFVTLKKLD